MIRYFTEYILNSLLTSYSVATNWTEQLTQMKSIHIYMYEYKAVGCKYWSRGYKTFFMLSSMRLKFILLMTVKMPTIVGILTFISRINY